MKELSIEEKAKRYDKAIERAKDYKNETIHRPLKVGENIMDYIFPELKEGERIRKALIKYYSFDKDGGSHALDNITPKQIVTWLEKQGEQKSTLPKWKYKKDNTPLSRDSLILNKYGCVAKSPSGALVSDVWVIDYDELAKLPKEEYEKQGEQKPTIEMKTPEESLGIDSDTYNKIVDECVYGEQKPAWSEEDEKILNYLLWFYDTRFRCNDTCGDDIKFGDIVTFLKSLKERYSWKPSDEQIKAIRLARSFVTDDFDEHPALSEILIELEKQLKKLREE